VIIANATGVCIARNDVRTTEEDERTGTREDVSRGARPRVRRRNDFDSSGRGEKTGETHEKEIGSDRVVNTASGAGGGEEVRRIRIYIYIRVCA